MPDIFDRPLDEATIRVRNGREADPTPEPPAPRYVPLDSYRAAVDVFMDVTATKMPDDEVIAALPRDSDGNLEYRTRIEVIEFPSASVVNVLSRSHFALQIQSLIDTGNTSTYISTLQKSQEPNGRWMIVDRGMRKGRMRRLDGLRDAKMAAKHEGVPVAYSEMSSSETLKEPAEVSIDTLECRILWMDMLGRPNVKRDVKGDIISEMDVTVKNTTDPALVDALVVQGRAMESIAAGLNRPPVGPSLPISLTKMEEDLAARERALEVRLRAAAEREVEAAGLAARARVLDEREKALDAMTKAAQVGPPNSAK